MEETKTETKTENNPESELVCKNCEFFSNIGTRGIEDPCIGLCYEEKEAVLRNEMAPYCSRKQNLIFGTHLVLEILKQVKQLIPSKKDSPSDEENINNLLSEISKIGASSESENIKRLKIMRALTNMV